MELIPTSSFVFLLKVEDIKYMKGKSGFSFLIPSSPLLRFIHSLVFQSSSISKSFQTTFLNAPTIFGIRTIAPEENP